jgi:hypothetical protein
MTPWEQRQQRKRKIERQLEELPKVNKPRKDGSAVFKLVGGKHHDITVRMYAPFDETPLIFPNGDRYEYCSTPIGKSKAHYFEYRPDPRPTI